MDLHDPFHDSYMTYPHIMPPPQADLGPFLSRREVPAINRKKTQHNKSVLVTCLFVSIEKCDAISMGEAKQNFPFWVVFFFDKMSSSTRKKTSKRIHRWECFDDAIPLDLGLPVWTLTQLIHQRLEKRSLKHLLVDIHIRVYEFT